MKVRTFLLFFVAVVLLAVTAYATSAAGPFTVQLNPLNNSGQSGSAMLTDLGNSMVQVDVSITGEPAGASEPMHIHTGTCTNLGAVVYPLTNVVDGKSTTKVDLTHPVTGTAVADINALISGTFAINGHKSASEMTTYVFCGNLSSAVAATSTVTTTATATTAATNTPTKAPTNTPTTAAATATTAATSAVTSTTTPSTLPTTGGAGLSNYTLIGIWFALMLLAAGVLVRRFQH